MNFTKVFICVLCVLVSLSIIAQDVTLLPNEADTLRFNNDTIWSPFVDSKLMLIPFEPGMYKSSISKKIGEHDGTNYQQIAQNFRIGLDNLLFIKTDSNYNVVRMLTDNERKKDLGIIYSNAKKEYRVLPKEPDNAPKKINLPKLLKKETKPNGTFIETGQLKSYNDNEDRFMATSISNKKLFNYLQETYSTVIYIFINQLDFNPSKDIDYRSFESENFERTISVHYSIYIGSTEIYSSIVSTQFSNKENSQKNIIVNYMPKLAKQIVQHIPIIITNKNSN